MLPVTEVDIFNKGLDVKGVRTFSCEDILMNIDVVNK